MGSVGLESVHRLVCIPGHEWPFFAADPRLRSVAFPFASFYSTSVHTRFVYTHSLSPMAPSPQNPALDVPPKDVKQALAEDKYDDCMSCRVTGTFRNRPLCDQDANIKVQDRLHSLASECTAITRACRIYGSRRRPSWPAHQSIEWAHDSWGLQLFQPRSWAWGCTELSINGAWLVKEEGTIDNVLRRRRFHVRY